MRSFRENREADHVDLPRPMWTLAKAVNVRGKRLTSWPSIRTDLRNAGAEVVDEEVCIDGQLTTSRGPQDMAAFCAAVVDQFAAVPARG